MDATIAIAILVTLLVGPLFFRLVEENLEIYCLAVGLFAINLSGGPDWELAKKALADPVPISAAVISAGFAFQYGRRWLDNGLDSIAARISRPAATALTVSIVALISSVITSIVAALVLVEALRSLRLHKEKLVRVTVVGCLAIGLGASLTPLGEPLSTIAIDSLQLEFFGLFTLLAPFVLPGIAACALLAGLFARGRHAAEQETPQAPESAAAVLTRGVKVFAFIAGLVLLGEAYAPVACAYLSKLSPASLFWANSAGAALDNATVIAIEIRGMPLHLARQAILSLLASGAMLVQGNIPNIIAAGSLGISAANWARVGVPLGLLFLVFYFFALQLS